MENSLAATRLAALGQEHRLEIFRLLVRAGDSGRAAGAIAEELGIPAPTLSFHLRTLSHAGLIASRRDGRSLLYSVTPGGVRELITFLTDDCCQARKSLCAVPGRADASPDRPAVLFLCSKNSARSQIAEALLRHRAGDAFDVHSAGLRPGRVHPLTKRVLREAGVDLGHARAKDFGEVLGKVAINWAIVVCEHAQRDCPKIWPFAKKRLFWPIDDPAAVTGSRAAKLDAFRAARDALDERIAQWLVEREREARSA